MPQRISQATDLDFAKLKREWNVSALGAGDRWIVTSPDGAELATVGEPLLRSPAGRALFALSATYPLADRFRSLAVEGEPGAALFTLEKLHAGKRRSIVRGPDGDELGTLSFARSEVREKHVGLRIRDAAGTSLGETVRGHSPGFLDGLVNYTVHDAAGDRVATVDGVPTRVDGFHSTFRLSITAPLSEPFHTLVLAAALACPYMRP